LNTSDTQQPAVLAVSGLIRYFDVSAPWLARMLGRLDRQTLKAVDGVEFSIARGQTFSIVGESGCGKSTVARMVVGLHKPTAGSIYYQGEDIFAPRSTAENAALRRKMQMVFQDPYASLNPRMRVSDIIAEPIHTHHLITDKARVAARVAELLELVGLAAADAEKYPHEFSGGQRQRISIARALASEPSFLVCDEPTSALDVSVQAQILNLMRRLQREFGLTYLFISHNLAVIHHMSDYIAVMYLGRFCEVAGKQTLFQRPLHPYTRLLLDTIPKLDPDGELRQPVGGEVPNPINPPDGCAFHPRCPYANDRCRRERPTAIIVGETKVACHGVEEDRIDVNTGLGVTQ
jgi:peptide/nickel transport system ATP-binding protein